MSDKSNCARDTAKSSSSASALARLRFAIAGANSARQLFNPCLTRGDAGAFTSVAITSKTRAFPDFSTARARLDGTENPCVECSIHSLPTNQLARILITAPALLHSVDFSERPRIGPDSDPKIADSSRFSGRFETGNIHASYYSREVCFSAHHRSLSRRYQE